MYVFCNSLTTRLSIVSLLMFFAGNSAACKKEQFSSELILFATFGNQPFTDAISTIEPDGSNLKKFLAPTRTRSYLHTSGQSFQSSLVVLTHELNQRQQIEDHNYLYWPKENKWEQLLSIKGSEGTAYIAPDGQRVAFIFAPEHQPTQLRLWIIDVNAKQPHQLVPIDNEQNTWHGYASWRPDSQEIAFIKSRLTPGGIETTAMRIAATGGEPIAILEPGVNTVQQFSV